MEGLEEEVQGTCKEVLEADTQEGPQITMESSPQEAPLTSLPQPHKQPKNSNPHEKQEKWKSF